MAPAKQRRSPKRSSRSEPDPDVLPYYKARVMSRSEQSLYWKLRILLPEHIILAQVQASRVLRIEKGSDYMKWFNRISQTSYDFVICDKSANPLAVIELDDSSHDSDKRRSDDARKDKALRSATLPIIRWRVGRIPSDTEIQRMFPSPRTQKSGYGGDTP